MTQVTIPTDTVTADTGLIPPSYDCKATNSVNSSVYLGWLVYPTNDTHSPPVADLQCSVVLVSVIWIIVLSNLEQSDVTCKHNHSSYSFLQL